jgi:hypothetical protein
MVIFAEGQAKAQEIEVRAVARLRKLETRRQENIENITKKAFEALPPPEQVSEQPVDEDWTSRFFQECQDIGDERMQQIWAHILTREVAHPGNFSPRTLSVVRDLTRSDAELFTKLCGLVWIIDKMHIPVVLDVEAPYVVAARLRFDLLMHLGAIGLIEVNTSGSFRLNKKSPKVDVNYMGTVHKLRSADGTERRLNIGSVVLTAAGSQLASIVDVERSAEYEKATLDQWKAHGWEEEA